MARVRLGRELERHPLKTHVCHGRIEGPHLRLPLRAELEAKPAVQHDLLAFDRQNAEYLAALELVQARRGWVKRLGFSEK